MLNAARGVVRFTAGKTLQDYIADDLLQSAVERRLEIIGEAANGVTGEFKKAHPEIAWSGIIKQRHVLAHAYGRIQHAKIWAIATQRIPALINLLELLLPPSPSD
ncbi:MAG TPA: HepT-like ribonuclease domain-containing protein [Phycisphaerae bacterium]|nr:HepT-like ribonuclease domain-containing protein [Phycisphaerae bacterium]